MKKPKIHSFANRLTRRILLVLLIVMGLACFIIFLLGGSFTNEEEESRHEAMLKSTAENITRVVSDVYVAVKNQIPYIQESLDDPDRMMTLVKRTVEQNSRIRSCGISFTENFYPKRGNFYIPYAIRRDSVTIDVGNLGTITHDYVNQEWFLRALGDEDGYWTEPFFEQNDTLAPLVAYVHPIFDKHGKPVAVIGADISLDWLREKLHRADRKLSAKQWIGSDQGENEDVKQKDKIEKKRKKREPYSMLVTREGTFIVHPNQKRIGRDNVTSIAEASTDTTTKVIVQRILAGSSSADYDSYDHFNYNCQDFDGVAGYVFFTTIKHSEWSLILFSPSATIDIISYVVGGMLAFFVLLAIITVWIISKYTIKKVTKPLKKLAQSADEIAKGNFNTPLPHIKHNDEIRLLRNSFEDMEISLTEYIDKLKETTASKAAIEQELRIAHDIQMGMLPKIFPPYPDRKDLDIFGLLNPAKDVGGDLFDFYIRDNQLFFCIGDVSGKGIPASLVMAVARSLFRNISSHTSEPDHIVSTLNKSLSENNETNMFVTFFVGVLDLNSGKLRYCNAGHDMIMLIGDQVNILPCKPNLPLGIEAEWSYIAQEVNIATNTTIFCYTDGLNEAENMQHAQFGIERVKEVAESMIREKINTPAQMVEHMRETLELFVGDMEQSDDLTMLAISLRP